MIRLFDSSGILKFRKGLCECEYSEMKITTSISRVFFIDPGCECKRRAKPEKGRNYKRRYDPQNRLLCRGGPPGRKTGAYY